MLVWLTNGEVAWQIPPGRIGTFYLWGYYLPPEGWVVTDRLNYGWLHGNAGEMRAVKEKVPV